jgi:dTDP-4-amino-4,6-dideoxygalactose transaminase
MTEHQSEAEERRSRQVGTEHQSEAEERIPLIEPVLRGNERRYLAECVTTNYVSSIGPFVERFEQEFAGRVGARHAVACASGTAALHVALLLAGSGPGCEVAVSDLTFIASVNAIAYTGATPLLVDSEPRTWNLDGELLLDEVRRRADTGRAFPRIVVPVHVLGHPVDIEPVLELRDRYGMVIVEDAAEALGASYTSGPAAGRSVGTVGTFGCFSFNGNKVITSGGGGMIVTDDASLAGRARHLTQQAKCRGRDYVHDDVGFNYRLTNVAAALGLAQLEQLDSFLGAKGRIAERYDAALDGLDASAPPRASWARPSWWLYSVLLGDAAAREAVLDCLEREAITARSIWPPLHSQQPYVATPRLGGDVADALYRRGLSLPCSVNLDPAQQDRVVTGLGKALMAS